MQFPSPAFYLNLIKSEVKLNDLKLFFISFVNLKLFSKSNFNIYSSAFLNLKFNYLFYLEK